MAEKKPFVVVLVDDDEDYYVLLREAFEKIGFKNDLHWIKDGEELMAYFKGSELSGYARDTTRPMVILLDLNMPRMNGYQVLEKMKSDAQLRLIPIIVLTTSKSEEDISRSYRLGANAFITKPADFSQITSMVEAFQKYWLGVVRLPHGKIT